MSGQHGGPPPLTTARRLVAGELARRGTSGEYRTVAAAEGEPHRVREDLLPGGAAAWREARARRPLLALAHVTDLQLADVQSPARFEYFNRYYGDPRFAELVPTQRPQEALLPHAVLATVETLNRLDVAPVTRAPLSLAVTTGDAIDNAQWNELAAFLALLDGGDVRLRSGGRRYEGVQRADWPDAVFWRPDGEPAGDRDVFRSMFGFPLAPGLLERALDPLCSPGLRLPWLACYGNHEALIQGVGVITPQVAAAMVGGRRPSQLPASIDPDAAVAAFVSEPHRFLGSGEVAVTADSGRRPVSRNEFVAAHLRAGTRPAGHGFTDENARLGTAYYVHDTPDVRFIGLDTSRTTGGAAGALDVDQLWWLQARLVEVHSSYRAADGREMHSGADDRLVVVFSHHGRDTLTNLGGAAPTTGADGDDLVGGEELAQLLHRFPNVVLWLNGHTHANAVRPRVDPVDRRRGFWEVTTCAIADWPCQTRVVELVDLGGGAMAVVLTMVDHDSPLGPGASLEGSALTTPQLAALHRELSANVPGAGAGSRLEGRPEDRNVVLPLRAPFDLTRLSAGLDAGLPVAR